MYLCVILYFTMMPVIAAIPQRFADSGFNYNFIPFVDWQIGRGAFRFETYANVLLFVPIGYLWQALDRKPAFWRTLGLGTGISLLAELLQLFLHRGLFELDDLVHNVLGTALGALLCLAAEKLRRQGKMQELPPSEQEVKHEQNEGKAE